MCVSGARDVNAIEDGSVKVVENIPVAADKWRLSIKRDIIVTLILWDGRHKISQVECKKNHMYQLANVVKQPFNRG